MRRPPLALCLALVAAPLAAQQGQRPAGWKVRFDSPSADSAKLSFVEMKPGFHVTTGPAVLLYNPALQAKGNYRAETTIHLFKPISGHAEAFGLVVGGTKLDGPDQSYLYFLVNDEGKYLVKRRDGAKTTDVVPWTATSAVVHYDAEKKSAANTLAIVAGAKDVEFLVNGTKVATQPRAGLPLDGTVGVRINHMLNVHVEKVDVSPAK